VLIVQLRDKPIRTNINDETHLPSGPSEYRSQITSKGLQRCKALGCVHTPSTGMPDSGDRNIEIPALVVTGTSILEYACQHTRAQKAHR
jgi:hypothetical protein